MLPLTTLDELDAVVARSAARPVLIFKHSGTCGTSAMAYEEVEAFMALGLNVEVDFVHVQVNRSVSQAIAARFKLRHESPQVLLIQDGLVCWQASHFRVTAEEIAKAVSKCQNPTPAKSS